MADVLKNKIILTDLARFRKIVDLERSERVGLPSGHHILRRELAKIPAGGSFTVGDRRYYVLPCGLDDFIMDGLKRNTQIVYPKEAGYILMKMDIGPGKTVAEAGMGSGALTAVLSRAVGSGGRVHSYEQDIGLINHAVKNLKLESEDSNITVHHRSIEQGILQENLDAFFLDVREPWKYLRHVYDALAPGAYLGILVPTANQVSRTLHAFGEYDFWVTEVTEIMVRHYKQVPARLRPMDRMIGHTGYLLFARKLGLGTLKPYLKQPPLLEDDEGYGELPETD